MTRQGMIPADRWEASSHATDVVELRVLLPSEQAAAIEATAVLLGLSMAALIRQAINDFLQSPAANQFVGEVAGRPTPPLSG